MNCLVVYKYNGSYIVGGYIGTTYIANYSALTAACSTLSGSSSTTFCGVCCGSALLEMVLNFLPAVAPSTDDEVLILRAAAAKLATPSAANMLALDNKMDTCSAEGQLVMIISSVE